MSSEGTTVATPPIRIAPAPSARPVAVPLPTHHDGSWSTPAPAPYVQDVLAVDFRAATDEEMFGVQPTVHDDLPDPAPWAARLGQALVEIMHGARPPAQVLRWTSDEVYTAVARRGALAARRAGHQMRQGHGINRLVRVRTARVCHPRDDVAEASLVVLDGRRIRALALRLEGRDGRWVVTALEVA
ncbi:Rv3235 family protein [Janibacter endophyticus]|uniref:Rv3235 family protein n=1 Tax=Janibacter endophyticus TaxID=2806261 RepID=UPI0027DD8FC3|nr:Rv3235 family protein [Janibacter endophyticus]